MILDLHAGIEHICGKLVEIRIDNSPEITVTQNNLAESLEIGMKKLQVLVKEMKSDASFAEAVEHVTGGPSSRPMPAENMYKSSYNMPVKKEMPSQNVRVKLQQDEGDSSDDQSGSDMEAEHQRMKRSRQNR